MITAKVLKKRISVAKKKQCIPVSKLKKAELIKAAVHYGVSTKKESKPFKVVRKKPAPFKAPVKKTTKIKEHPVNLQSRRYTAEETVKRIKDFNRKMKKPILLKNYIGKDREESIDNLEKIIIKLQREYNTIQENKAGSDDYDFDKLTRDGFLEIRTFMSTPKKIDDKLRTARKQLNKHFR